MEYGKRLSNTPQAAARRWLLPLFFLCMMSKCQPCSWGRKGAVRESVNDGWRVRILRSLPPLCVFSNGGTSGLLPLPSLSPSQSLVVKAGGLVAAGLGKVFLGKWEKALKITRFVFITPLCHHSHPSLQTWHGFSSCRPK